MPDSVDEVCSAPASVTIAGRRYIPGADRGVATMLTCASWILQRLPGQVLETQRADVIQTLAEARDLVIEVAVTPTPAVRIRDGGCWWRSRRTGDAWQTPGVGGPADRQQAP